MTEQNRRQWGGKLATVTHMLGFESGNAPAVGLSAPSMQMGDLPARKEYGITQAPAVWVKDFALAEMAPCVRRGNSLPLRENDDLRSAGGSHLNDTIHLLIGTNAKNSPP